MSEKKADFILLATLSSRPVDFERCDVNFLTRRYQSPTRLFDLPPFETLASLHNGHASYEGSLVAYKLSIADSQVRAKELFRIQPGRKIQHAAIADSRLILCYEDRVQVLDPWMPLIDHASIESLHSFWVDDNWFAGLHTIFPLGPDFCVISSSAADAVLHLDLGARRVVKRWRLPVELFGSNYRLTDQSSLKDHYIHNDLQLGHLNCAFPDSQGNVWVSTLIGGTVGRFDLNGRYEMIARGFVGIHGIRELPQTDCLYFSDSCFGCLTVMDRNGKIQRRYSVDSKWMHDAQHLAGDLFLFGLGDKNRVLGDDVSSGARRMDFEIRPELGYVQFLSVHPLPAGF